MTIHHNERTEERLRDAVGAAADAFLEDATPPGLDVRGRRPTVPARRWPVVALAAAAAAILFGGVPYLLIHSGDNEGTGTMIEPKNGIEAADPPPYYLSIESSAGVPATSLSVNPRRIRGVVRDARTGRQVGTLPGENYGFVAAAPDQRTFYLTRVTGRTQCSGEITRVRLDDNGAVAEHEVVARDEAMPSSGRCCGSCGLTTTGSMGARKLWKAARRAGHDIGRDQTARLMRAEDIEGVVRTRRVRHHRRDDEGARGTRTWSSGTSPRPGRTSCGSRT